MKTLTHDTIKASDLSPEDRADLERLATDKGPLSESLRKVLAPILRMVAAGRDFRVVEEPGFLSPEELAQRLKLPVDAVLHLIRVDRLPAIFKSSGYEIALSDAAKVEHQFRALHAVIDGGTGL